MKEYVLIYAAPHSVEAQDKILLILKDRPEFQRGRFNLPGGKVEPGEKPEEAALRELREECNLGPYPDHRHHEDENGNFVPRIVFCDTCTSSLSSQCPFLMGKIIGPNEIVYCYTIYVNEFRELKPREGETEKAFWIPWDDVYWDKRLMPNLRVIIPLMRDHVNGWEMHIEETFTNKTETTFRMKIKSEAHEGFRSSPVVDDLLAGKYIIAPRMTPCNSKNDCVESGYTACPAVKSKFTWRDWFSFLFPGENMKALMMVAVLCLIGCGSDQDTPLVPKEVAKPTKKLVMVDFKGDLTVQVKGSFGNASCDVDCSSEVGNGDEEYIYTYTFKNTGKTKCLFRWEVLDHVMGKIPFIWELEPDKAYVVRHLVKSRPVYVYRTATLFEKNVKKGSFNASFKDMNIIVSDEDFWFSAQTTVRTIVPKTVTRENDYK